MLYIIRHGRTDWNDMRKLQGRTDIPLNDAGRAMAREAAREYSDVHFDVCYCSPLSRAKETAEILLEGREVPIIIDERLIEMSFGIYEGIEDSFANTNCPVNVLFKNPENYNFTIEGAESWNDIFSRTGEFLEKVAYPLVNDGKDVLIVGHGAMNSCIINQVWKLPLKDYWSAGIKNCELKKLM